MEPSDMSLLVTLDALLQEGSVTGAARRVGLSTPAMSHALARIREKMGDPILVRSGRGMVLTPRAEALKPRVASIVADARQALEPQRPFVAHELAQTFVVHGTDYVLTVLGLAVDRLLHDEAPRVSLRFVPNTSDDSALLRNGESDLAVGIYGELPPEMRSRPLLTDRFVCVTRKHHPIVGKKLSLDEFTTLPHIQVAPRGKPGGYIDDVLHSRGLERTVARAVPYFMTALQLAGQTDYLLVISERIASRFASIFNLTVHEVPLELRPYALSLLWSPRFDGDAAHRFLRDVFTRAARDAAPERHDAPRTRLNKADPRPRGHSAKRRPAEG
jgi:DNA-binding transcriptional LysR family regulator